MKLISTVLRRWPLVALLAVLCASTVSARGQAKAEPDMPGEVLVKLRSTAGLQPLLLKHRLTLVSRFGARPIYRLQVGAGVATQDVIRLLLRDPEVMLAETNPVQRSPEARGNMPWAIGTKADKEASWAPQALRLAPAHELSTGVGIRVAVLDTGIDADHLELRDHVLPGKDFVDSGPLPSEVAGGAGFGHGTHVAGLVAQVAPGAKIVPLRVLDADGVGNAWVLAEALLYAIDPDLNPATADGAHVVNMSLGSMARTGILKTIEFIATCSTPVAGDPIADLSDPGYADDLARCANASVGTVIVAAAGNDGSKHVKQYPAAESVYGLIPVAATRADGRLAAFSNYGNWIQVAAPGEGITSTLPGGGYGTWSGTSMASPLVAGVAALVRAANPELTPRDVAERIERTAGGICGKVSQVRVDALAAVSNTVAPTGTCR